MKSRATLALFVAFAACLILTLALRPRMPEARVSAYSSDLSQSLPSGLKECVESWPAVSAPKDYYDARWSESFTSEASARWPR